MEKCWLKIYDDIAEGYRYIDRDRIDNFFVDDDAVIVLALKDGEQVTVDQYTEPELAQMVIENIMTCKANFGIFPEQNKLKEWLKTHGDKDNKSE